jgi:glycolate oxidase
MDKRILEEFIHLVRSFLNEEQIITDKEGMSHFCYDATEMRFMPDVVLLPYSTEEVSRIMKLAYASDIPVTPQGGRTGLGRGASCSGRVGPISAQNE